MRLGILGGTFDPVHLGHLIVAQEAAARLALDRVVFIPAGRPWLKAAAPLASGRHRLAMLRAAVRDNPAFEVSAVEVDRVGPSYTIDTLAGFQGEFGDDADLYFIVGADALADLPRWRSPERVLALCTMVAVARPGHPLRAPDGLERLYPGAGDRLVALGGPEIGISATEVRRRVAEGRPVHYWVPAAVERYIARHGLYREEAMT